MTIQQLKYIIAAGQTGSFAKAAEQCGITQPTLSMMIAKLEDELDVRLFDRTNRRVTPTAIGGRIISQAINAVKETERIKEIVDETRDSLEGDLRLSVGPSIAPYLLPKFIRRYGADYPDVSLTIEEMRPHNMFDALTQGTIDMAIAIGGNSRDGILEIPLYNEPFWLYVSEACRHRIDDFTPELLSHHNMWIMKEAQCQRESAFSFCKARDTGRRVYEAGNIDTLVRVVDENGGFTIIPEMHLPMLSPLQRENVKPLQADNHSMRRVAIYIRHDYIRQKMLNSIISTLKKIIPSHMLDPYILKPQINL